MNAGPQTQVQHGQPQAQTHGQTDALTNAQARADTGAPAGVEALGALKRRFHALVFAEVVAVILGMTALTAHFALHLQGALALFAGIIAVAVLLQVWFILAFRNDMKKGV